MAKKTRKFKTEVQQLLDLVVHSLYSKKEIFLRELISNASDAIDRAQFEALTDKQIQEDGGDWKIRLAVDKKARTLTISDNGIGMTPEEVEKNVGTIANSGTRTFLESLKAGAGGAGPEFIGQFGVGFYSAFMVADKVELITRRAGEGTRAVKWTSSGAGNYTLEDVEKATRGTEITLYLSEGMDRFLEEWQIRQIVKQYSDYIAYPVVMDIVRRKPADDAGGEPEETVEQQTLNSMKAIWKKARGDVSDEEYNAFYKHVSHDFSDPLRVIHYAAEGATEFKALLYLPASAPMDMLMREDRRGVHLYVKNVHITDDCKDLLPEYLRFVRGVVDSSDLPLNVSREMLQDDAVIRRINKSLVGRILRELKDMQEKTPDEFLAFYKEFGVILKEGIHFDYENAEKLNNLLMFYSTKSGGDRPLSLRDYVDRMPEGQKDIYYIMADGRAAAANSPHLEVFKKKDYEVLFLIDPIDEWVVQRLTEYDGKKLVPIQRGDLDLDSDEEKKEHEEQRQEAHKEYEDLLAAIQKRLDEHVKEVRLSSRLTDSACCLVVDEAGMNPSMERIMKAMHQEVPVTKRILELNPDHPLLGKMKALYDEDPVSSRLDDYVELIYDQALLTEGSPIENPLRFTQLVSDLMVAAD